MYKHILVAVDLSDDGGWRQPLVAGAEQARRFGAELIVLTVLREVEAMVRAEVAPLGYELFVADLENKLAARVRGREPGFRPHPGSAARRGYIRPERAGD
jgi:nucleotide-binding universal stress UspA family protein